MPASCVFRGLLPVTPSALCLLGPSSAVALDKAGQHGDPTAIA